MKLSITITIRNSPLQEKESDNIITYVTQKTIRISGGYRGISRDIIQNILLACFERRAFPFLSEQPALICTLERSDLFPAGRRDFVVLWAAQIKKRDGFLKPRKDRAGYLGGYLGISGDIRYLPQFDGHFEKEYTMNLKGVSNEGEAGIYERV